MDAPESLDLNESPEELAPGWEKKHDTKMNRFFYVNHELRAISWLRPTMAVAGSNRPWAGRVRGLEGEKAGGEREREGGGPRERGRDGRSKASSTSVYLLHAPLPPSPTAQEAGEVKSIEPVSKFSDYQIVGNGFKSRMRVSQEVLFSHMASGDGGLDWGLDCDAASVSVTGFSLGSEPDARDTELDREWDELALEEGLEHELRTKLEEAMGHDYARIKQQEKDFVDNLKYIDLEQALDEGDALIC